MKAERNKMAAENFSYFIGEESEQFSFIKVPKLFFTSISFESLSYGAKILYGLLLDRMSLSRKNKWLDEKKRVYVIYTIEGICEDFHVSRTLAIRFLKELEDFGLIEKKRRPNAATMIYVKNFVFAEETQETDREQTLYREVQKMPETQGSPEYGLPEVQNMEVQNMDFHKSPKTQGSPEYGFPEIQNLEVQNMESNKTDINNKDDDEIVTRLKERIGYDSLIRENGRETVDRLLFSLSELFRTDERSCYINNKKAAVEEVRRKVLQNLTLENFRMICRNIQERGADRIYNLKAYVIACFYNFEQIKSAGKIKKSASSRKPATVNSFMNFTQNVYDFNELENQLLNAGRETKVKTDKDSVR